MLLSLKKDNLNFAIRNLIFPSITPNNKKIVNQSDIKSKAAILSVCSNTLLVIGKFIIGILIGSVSIISEAIHSCTDLLAAVIAYFAVKTSSAPPDKGHPYGHGRIENISSAIEATLIILASGWIIWESIQKILHPGPIHNLWLGVLIMFISSLINLLVSRHLFKIASVTQSPALKGDAWHLMTDVWTSAGVMLGLLIVWIGNLLFPQVNLHLIDPFIGIIVALFILKTGISLIIQSFNELMDPSLPKEEEKIILEHIFHFSPIIRGFHKFRTRSVGAYRFIDFHLKVDRNMPIYKAHELNHQIQNDIEKHLKNCSVTIHFEPCDECSESCLQNCALSPDERKELKLPPYNTP